MNHFDPKSMFLDLGGRGKLPVTWPVVRCVLDVKDGPLDPPIASDVAILQPIKDGLGISGSDRIYSRALMERIRGGGTDDFTMRCILMILFAKILAPDSGAHISGHVVNMASMNLEDYANIDLCKFVVDHLRYAAEIWRDGPKSTALGCTAFLVLRSSKSTCYYVSKGKEKVTAASENIRKRKHLPKEEAEQQPAFGEEQLAFVGMFPSLRKQLGPFIDSLGSKRNEIGLQALEKYDKEVEQMMSNLYKAPDHVVRVITRLCNTNEPKLTYSRKSKRRRGDPLHEDHHPVPDQSAGRDSNTTRWCLNLAGDHARVQQPTNTAAAGAAGGLVEEPKNDDVPSSSHMQDQSEAHYGAPADDEDLGHDECLDAIQEEVNTLVSKICIEDGASPMKIVSPTAMASPASLAPTFAAYVQGENHAVTTKLDFDASNDPLIGSIPSMLHRRRPIANSKYKSPFKLDISKPNIDGTEATEVYKLICSEQPQPELDEGHLINYANEAILWNRQELINSFGIGNKFGNDTMFFLSRCLLFDDISHRKENVGYRVIIPTSAILHNLQTLVFIFVFFGTMELLNSEDSNTSYSFEHAYKNINYDIMEYVLTDAQLIFLPMIDKEHWTVMCFNKIDQHIDVLDLAGAMRSKATKVEDEKMIQKSDRQIS